MMLILEKEKNPSLNGQDQNQISNSVLSGFQDLFSFALPDHGH